MQEKSESGNINEEKLPLSVKVAEGKTKIVWETVIPNLVTIESKDDITAGDGLRRDLLEGKGKLATETTSNVFELLNSKGISTHFIHRDTETSFVAHHAEMIPLECVARRLVAGSSLARNPNLSEGQRFDNIPVEFYFKDDSRHDPMIQYEKGTCRVNLFNPKDPIGTREPIGQMTLEELGVTEEELDEMEKSTREVFEIVEEAWRAQSVSLVDMKIEHGRDDLGKLMVADVIDNDSWRIWPEGDPAKMLDKQRYRNNEGLPIILDNYQQVAEMTKAFTA